MPTVETRAAELYYETTGEGPPVAFVGDAGLGAWQWGWQHRAVAGPYRALVYDHRGVGRSSGVDDDSTVQMLAADLRAVVRAADLGRPHLVGAGLGGMVALEYARRNAVRSLTLLGTSPGGAHERSALPPVTARPTGCAPLDAPALRESLADLLSPDFRERQPEVVEGVLEWRAEEDASPAVCRRQSAAMDAYRATELYELTAPALVIHGDDDRVVPAADGRLLADSLPRGEFLGLEAGHLVGVERSRRVNDRLLAHLEAAER